MPVEEKITERAAYDRGGAAFEDGKDYETANPFDEINETDLVAAWRSGWMAAKHLTPDLKYVDKEEAAGEDVLRKEGIPLLHACYRPAQSKPWGCRGCTLYQYSPTFSKRDREEYKAQLKTDRHHFKNASYNFEATAPVGQVDTMFVFESPSIKEDESGQAFVGAGSHMFIRNAKNAGIDLSKCAMTFTVRCCAKRIGDKPTKAHATYCSKFMVQDVLQYRPKTIVTFGALPTQMLLGKPGAAVTQYQGVPQNVTLCGGQHECVVYPMLSPDHIKRHDYMSVKYADAWMDLGKYVRGESGGVRVDKSDYEIVADVDDAIALCKRLKAYKVISVDLETSGLNPYAVGARVSIISFAVDTKRGYSVPYNHNDAPNWTVSERKRFVDEGLRPLLQRPYGTVSIIWHNGKFDGKWFPIHFGFTPTDLAEDTMLTHYAADENEEHGLKPLALRWTDMGDYDAELDKYLATHFPKDAPRYDLVPLDIIGRYGAQDPVAALKLRQCLRPKVEEQGPLVEALAYQALPMFSHALMRLEESGCAIDIDYAKSVLPMMTKAAEDSYNDIMAEPNVRQFIRDREAKHRAGMVRPKPIEEKRYFEFKLGSPQQLAELLFDPKYYNHPVIEEHKKGGGAKYNEKTYFGGDAEQGQYERKKQPSTNKEVMNELAENHGSPIAKKIMAYRLDHSLEHTFTRPLIARVEESAQRILHANVLLHGTKTGRTACVSAETLVLTDRGRVPISNMRGGVYRSLTHNGRWAKVKRAFTKGFERMYRVTLENGNTIECTAAHVFYTPQGWSSLAEVALGEWIYSVSDEGGNVWSNADNFDRRIVSGNIRQAGHDCTRSDGGVWNKSPCNSNVHNSVEGWDQSGVDEGEALASQQPDAMQSARSATASRKRSYRQVACDGRIWRSSIRDVAGVRDFGVSREATFDRARDSRTTDGAERDVVHRFRYGASARRSFSNACFVHSGTRLSDRSRTVLVDTVRRIFAVDASCIFSERPSTEIWALSRAFSSIRCSSGVELESRGSNVGNGAPRRWHPASARGNARQASAYRLLLSRGELGRGDRRIESHLARESVSGQIESAGCFPEGLDADAVHGQGRGERYSAGGRKYQATAIVSVVDIGVREVWDLEVEGDESYIAEGFVNHNSRDPNLQAIPGKSAGIVKRFFISRYGKDGCIIGIDYSQIELRILAAIANDREMLEAYKSGADLHKLTACLIFNMTMVEYEALDETEKERRRTIAKRVNFGIPYGVSGKGISGMLKGEGIEVDEMTCDTYVDIFFEKKPRVKEWIDRVRNSTAASAESLSMFGRKRRLEPVYSVRSQVVERTLRQAINHPIQSTASDLTQTALCIMDQEIQARRGAGDHIAIHPAIRAAVKVDERWNEVDMTLTVHDSILLDCRREMAQKVMAMALRITSNVVDLAPMVWGDVIEEPLRALHRVNIVAEAKVGPNWRDGQKVKDPKKDVPMALYIGDKKRELFDADPHFKWTKDHDKKFAAEFAAQAA